MSDEKGSSLNVQDFYVEVAIVGLIIGITIGVLIICIREIVYKRSNHNYENLRNYSSAIPSTLSSTMSKYPINIPIGASSRANFPQSMASRMKQNSSRL